MNQAEVEEFVASLDNVQREDNYGYAFFFVGDDHRRAFVTIANSDNEYDNVSNLDRVGVFRINIGVSRQTFNDLLADTNDGDVDYSALDVFLPHPDYAKQNYLCILNPSETNVEATRQLIVEAHRLAADRLSRRSSRQS